MSLLRKYYNEEYLYKNDIDFSDVSLEEREMIVSTLGYDMYVAWFPVDKAYKEFKDSLFEALDNRIYKWMLKMYFKIKE